MTDEPRQQKDLSDLPPDEAYAVKCLRGTSEPLRAFQSNQLVLACGREAVCTWGTLFRLLGRGVVQLDETAQRLDRYELAEDWR